MTEQCPPVDRDEVKARLEADFDDWFARLQALTSEVLVPEDWTERWFDGWTPEDAWSAGPDDE